MKGADRAPDDVRFETGMPFHEGDFGHGWQPDPFITDDQALVLHLHNAGSSCSPTAAMLGSKIVRHAQRLTNIERVHAVCGGPPERPPRHAECSTDGRRVGRASARRGRPRPLHGLGSRARDRDPHA